MTGARSRRIAAAALLGMLGSGCSGGGGGNTMAGAQDDALAEAGPSLKRDIQPIFDDNCVACHQTGSAQQGLVLEAGKSFGNLVGVKSQESALNYVEPGKPDKSYLILKLTGKHQEIGGSGAAMPLGDALVPTQISAIERWVAAGAKDN